MKIIKWILVMSILMLLLDSCNKYDFQTGIVGTVRFGSGDCMPPVSHDDSDFYPYTGTLYFIIKEDLDNLGVENFSALLENSISVYVKNGNLLFGLPPETYVVMPKDLFQYTDANTIIIVTDEVIEKDFDFWQCTSY